MAFAMVGTFVAGFGAGWVARSFTHSSRGALVGIILGAHLARDEFARIFGQTMEWTEDLFAEARSIYETRENSDG